MRLGTARTAWFRDLGPAVNGGNNASQLLFCTSPLTCLACSKDKNTDERKSDPWW